MPMKAKSRGKNQKYVSSEEAPYSFFKTEISLYGGEAVRLTRESLKALGIDPFHFVEAYYNPKLDRFEIHYDTGYALNLSGEVLLDKKNRELVVSLWDKVGDYSEAFRIKLFDDEYKMAKKFFNKKPKKAEKTYDFFVWLLEKLMSRNTIIARINKKRR